MHRLPLVLLIAALSAASLPGPVDAEEMASTTHQQHAGVQDPKPLNTESAADYDTKLTAEQNDWTPEWVERRDEINDELDALKVRIGELAPDAVIGGVLPTSQNGTARLFLHGPMDAKIAALIDAVSVPIEVIPHQPYTFKELEARSKEVSTALTTLGFLDFSVSFGFDQGGTVDVEVAPSTPDIDASDVLELLPLSMRESVRVRVQSRENFRYLLAFGGLRLRDGVQPSCTSGFSVRRIGNLSDTGISTAAHCTGIDTVVHGSTTHQTLYRAGHLGPWGDVEIHETAQSETRQFHANAGTIFDVVALMSRSSIDVGETLCWYGRSSNDRDCSLEVSATSVSCTIGGLTVNRQIRMNGSSYATGGDSGGPVSRGARVAATVTAKCPELVFSVADLFDEAVGWKVRTPP